MLNKCQIKSKDDLGHKDRGMLFSKILWKVLTVIYIKINKEGGYLFESIRKVFGLYNEV